MDLDEIAIAENLELSTPVYLSEDMSKGPDSISFNADTLDFLETFLDEGRALVWWSVGGGVVYERLIGDSGAPTWTRRAP